MKDFFDKMIEYLDTAPREEIKEKWDKTSQFDNSGGPTIGELLSCFNNNFNMSIKDIQSVETIQVNTTRPEVYSGFVF